MKQSDHIASVRYTDCGDGSTSVTVLFEDGSEFHQNADLSPDEDVVSVRVGTEMTYPVRVSELGCTAAANLQQSNQ